MCECCGTGTGTVMVMATAMDTSTSWIGLYVLLPLQCKMQDLEDFPFLPGAKPAVASELVRDAIRLSLLSELLL